MQLRKAIEDVNSSAMFGRSPDKVTGTPNPQNMVLVQQATQEDNKSGSRHFVYSFFKFKIQEISGLSCRRIAIIGI